jgi:hypothetical protein
MSNISLPNPATGQDAVAAILATLSGASVVPPGVVVTPTPAGGGTTIKYVVVAKSNGAIIPSAVTQTTTGPSTLSLTAFNTITWNLSTTGLLALTFDVYRTSGGATQGKIASNLPATAVSLVDTGLVGDGTAAPAFNTSGVVGLTVIDAIQVAAGSADAITIPAGTVFITTAGVDALTLPLPIAGSAVSGGQDGAKLLIYSTTAYAHTVTTPANGFNGATHICTFTGAASNYISLTAYNGSWYVTGNLNGTLT